jgi:hypothetical protein
MSRQSAIPAQRKNYGKEFGSLVGLRPARQGAGEIQWVVVRIKDAASSSPQARTGVVSASAIGENNHFAAAVELSLSSSLPPGVA